MTTTRDRDSVWPNRGMAEDQLSGAVIRRTPPAATQHAVHRPVQPRTPRPAMYDD